MSFSQQSGLRYIQFDTLKVRHAVFTRHGGVSPKPWHSLNLGGTVGDEIERVRKNRSLCFEVLCPSHTLGGEWKVSPIRIDLDKNAKSGVVNIVNEGTERLTVQMKAMEWTQNAEGKDVYTETEDLIFFPKIMTIEKQEERILRTGIKIPAVAKEKTYRLFVEEIPEPKKSEGVNVAIAIRFGVPIFVKPLKAEPKGEIQKIELSKGLGSATVKNTGNIHFMINTVSIKRKKRQRRRDIRNKCERLVPPERRIKNL